MAPRTRRGQEATAGAPSGVAEQHVAGRRWYLDNLKVLLIATIIAGHGIAGYSGFDFWPYAEMKEVELSAVTQGLMMWAVGPLVLILIPLLFLVAGLLAPPSLERRGPGAYARSRLVRLGVPFTFYVVLVQPLVMYPVHPPGENPTSYWDEFVGAGDRTLDTGPLWFVGTLLVFSLGYAAWAALWGAHRRTRAARGLDVRRLLLVAVPVAVATYLVRVVVPFGGSNVGLSLNVWEWPACLTLFVLGIVMSGRGWLGEVPGRAWHQARAVALVGFVGMVAFVATAIAVGLEADQWWGGSWHWSSLGWSFFEVLVGIFGSVWVLGLAQRHLDRPLRWISPPVARSAFGAFVLQTPVLIGFAVAFRVVPVPAELKALAVAAASVAASFGLSWLLIEHVPGVKRIL